MLGQMFFSTIATKYLYLWITDRRKTSTSDKKKQQLNALESAAHRFEILCDRIVPNRCGWVVQGGQIHSMSLPSEGDKRTSTSFEHFDFFFCQTFFRTALEIVKCLTMTPHCHTAVDNYNCLKSFVSRMNEWNKLKFYRHKAEQKR